MAFSKKQIVIGVLLAASVFAAAEKPIDSLLHFGDSKSLHDGSKGNNAMMTPSHAVLVARDQAKLSSQFAGEIAKIGVQSGSDFKKGQVLIQFKCEEQIAHYQKALAEERSTKEAESAAIQLDKLESISKLEVAKAKAAYKQARAEALFTTAVLSKCRIRAPYAGSVVNLSVKAHETVKPGDPLIEIVNNNSLIVEVYAPSSWLTWLKIKTPFYIKLKEYPKIVRARVVKIGPAVDTTSQSIQIYGKLDGRYHGLINGMSGLAYFEGQPNE